MKKSFYLRHLILPAQLIILLMFGIIAITCNAPRNNPLDPENPSYLYGEATGVVYTLSIPKRAIEGAGVYSGGSLLAVTDVNGKFVIQGLEKKNISLRISKTGYSTDSVSISWSGGKTSAVEVYLNQIPVMDSVSLYVTSVSRYTLPALHQLSVRVKISDKDNDIDSVFIVSEALSLHKQLTYNVTDKEFQKDIPSYDLLDSDIESIIGLPFSIEVKDASGKKYTFATGGVKRVIRQPIQSVTPGNGDTVSLPLRLTWQPYDGLFPYRQLVQVYSNDLDVNPVLVWEKDAVDSDSTGVTVEKTLPSGSYFWVIWCVDAYSDRMRSNPASFNLK